MNCKQNYAKEFEKQLSNPIEQVNNLIALAKKLKDKYGDLEDRNDDSAKYETNADDDEPNTPEEMEKADAYWESLRKGEE